MLTDNTNNIVTISKKWLADRIVKAFEGLEKQDESSCYCVDFDGNNITLDGHFNLEELVNLIVDGTNA